MPTEHEGPRLPMGLPRVTREDAAAARQDVQLAIRGYPDRQSFIRGTIQITSPTRSLERMSLRTSLLMISQEMGIDRLGLGERGTQDRELAEEFDFGAAYGYRFVQSLREKGYVLPEVTTTDHVEPLARKEVHSARDIYDVKGIVDDMLRLPPQGSDPLDFTVEAMLTENPELEESVTSLTPMEQQGFRAVYTLIRNQYLSDQFERALDIEES